MPFEFNALFDRANCHIRATRVQILPRETPKERPHKHYSMEFHCIFSGEEIVTLPRENRKIHLTPGKILLLPVGIYHGVQTENSAVERLCFNFSAEPAEKEPSPIVDLFLNITEPVVFDSEETAVLVQQCKMLCQNLHTPLLELRQGIHFLNIALTLMSNVRGVDDIAPTANPLTLRQKWIIEDYITQHYTDNTGIEGLANALFLSQRQTSTLVKRFFGEDFKSLIIRRRMELADIYLQDLDKRLEEISYEVGYRSYSGFQLCFKRYFGITPKQRRLQLQQERTK